MNVGGGEGRAVGGRSAVSYGAAGAVNNSQAKSLTRPSRGQMRDPQDVYVSLLFSSLNSVGHSRPQSENGAQKCFQAE